MRQSRLAEEQFRSAVEAERGSVNGGFGLVLRLFCRCPRRGHRPRCYLLRGTTDCILLFPLRGSVSRDGGRLRV
jgi:hypothetical protein